MCVFCVFTKNQGGFIYIYLSMFGGMLLAIPLLTNDCVVIVFCEVEVPPGVVQTVRSGVLRSPLLARLKGEVKML